MSKRDVKLYLEDIKKAMLRIAEYIRGLSARDFYKDPKTMDAVVRNLSVIGEAVKNIPVKTKSDYPLIPWEEIVGMRNKIIHEYFGVDEKILWKTVKKDLPELKKQLGDLFE
jgi:uncharacterized protein with HEPN domain